jgi:hypothetical protein
MIFNTVKTFVESVGRERTSTRGELDQLRIKYTGPTSLADQFAPGMNATLLQYPGMQVQTVRKIGDVAGITNLEVDYRGRFDAKHKPDFGDVLIEVSSAEGEIEYQQIFSALVESTGTPSAPAGLYKVGLRTQILRFVGLSTTYRYVMNPKPAQKPTGPLFGDGIGPGFISQNTRFGGEGSVTYTFDPNPLVAYMQTQHLESAPVADLYCSAYQAVPTSQDWYQVVETWTSRFIQQVT